MHIQVLYFFSVVTLTLSIHDSDSEYPKCIDVTVSQNNNQADGSSSSTKAWTSTPFCDQSTHKPLTTSLSRYTRSCMYGRRFFRHVPSSSVDALRALTVIMGGSIAVQLVSDDNDEEERIAVPRCRMSASLAKGARHHVLETADRRMLDNWIVSTPSMMKTSLESADTSRNQDGLDLFDLIGEDGNEKPIEPTESEDKISDGTSTIHVYDFIIVGHGNAGAAALHTLIETCPDARIALIDPLRVPPSSLMGGQNKHYKSTVTGFNPKTKSITLLTASETVVQYKHGILIATGARGAPPPMELFEESSLSRVLELRTTELVAVSKRPVMAPEFTRKAVADAASRGAKIAILGSGFEALDLLLVAEQEGRKKPTICFSSPGPVWNILPNYLSSELRRKLQKRDIDIQDRCYVRYVADIKYSSTKKLELHTAKTFDLLDTRRTVLDLLIIAPDMFGNKGTAALPTNQIPDRMKESSDGRPWYKTWSQLCKTSALEPSTVACFEDDGRIAVNTELCVASQIYAAGSVAKYPNSSTGHSSIAGEGSIDGAEAGRVAALNMSRNYLLTGGRKRNRWNSTTTEDDIINSHSFASNSVPVWRSDITSYPCGNGHRISALSSIGIQALCVGNCDSERQGTRGFWWTNSSAQRKITRMIEEEEEDEDTGPSQTRFHRRRMSRKRKRLGLVSPIYGIGVVFYLDNIGQIQGIMTWGLPYAEYEGGPVNETLLSHLKHVIATNAGVSALDAEENHQLMNLALGKACQMIVSLAARRHISHMTRVTHGLDGPIDGFSMPLYRYTEVGNLKNNTLNVLKRKEGNGLGVLGEDLYARDEFAIEEGISAMRITQSIEEMTPANIPITQYPITVVPFQLEEAYGEKAASLESLVELNRYLAVQRGWESNENRARPGKEDPIWLRPGDERRNTSRKQMIIDAYRSIMFPHRS
jgi:hypothetical protein